LTPPSLAERLAEGLRQAILVVVPDVGHWVMKEHAAAVDLLIAGFLARLELTDG
jgi:pimeloyl-ACP methyl ester carboxylesterase